jgi:hypothetical protein
MTNAEIVTVARSLGTEARIMGATVRGVTLEIFYVPGGEELFQLRQSGSPALVDVRPFPATEAGLAAARREARDRAELLQL